MFPVENEALKNRIIASLQDELHDTVKAWEMKKNGTYRRAEREMPLLNSQEARVLGHASFDLHE